MLRVHADRGGITTPLLCSLERSEITAKATGEIIDEETSAAQKDGIDPAPKLEIQQSRQMPAQGISPATPGECESGYGIDPMSCSNDPGQRRGRRDLDALDLPLESRGNSAQQRFVAEILEAVESDQKDSHNRIDRAPLIMDALIFLADKGMAHRWKGPSGVDQV